MLNGPKAEPIGRLRPARAVVAAVAPCVALGLWQVLGGAYLGQSPGRVRRGWMIPVMTVVAGPVGLTPECTSGTVPLQSHRHRSQACRMGRAFSPAGPNVQARRALIYSCQTGGVYGP